MGCIESIYKNKNARWITQWHFTAFLQSDLRFNHPFFITRREMEREAQDLQTFGRWLRMKDVGPICRDIVFRSGLCSKRRCSPLTRPGIWRVLMCEHVLPLNLPKPHWSYFLWGTRMQEPYTHPPHAPLLSLLLPSYSSFAASLTFGWPCGGVQQFCSRFSRFTHSRHFHVLDTSETLPPAPLSPIFPSVSLFAVPSLPLFATSLSPYTSSHTLALFQSLVSWLAVLGRFLAIMESHKWTYYIRSTSTHHINSTYHGKLDSQFISIEFSISLSLSLQSDSLKSIVLFVDF